ncbi:hypothetical protein WME90_48235 [Sorangium sp. So ce375]|uniref:hypothetical protein n=1 Tax=Sorangium sp. So ce375 TaxID=3133306 RepID=UPI003F5B8669
MQELQINGAMNGEAGLSGDESGPQEESRKGRAFLTSLVRELFQTERSAMIHPRIEADRLGDVPPARAMRAVSAHAEAALSEICPLLRERELPISAGGLAVGEAFSALRERLADHLLSTERSYRGTLLGMRHGVDLVELLQYVATVEGDTPLAAWCARWLSMRKPLVEVVADELAWFAARPARAMRAAKDDVIAHLLRGLANGVELGAQRLRRLVTFAG